MEMLSEKWLLEYESELLSEVPVTPKKWKKLEEELICFSCGELFSLLRTTLCLHTICEKCTCIYSYTSLYCTQEMKGFCCTMCKALFDKAQLKFVV